MSARHAFFPQRPASTVAQQNEHVETSQDGAHDDLYLNNNSQQNPIAQDHETLAMNLKAFSKPRTLAALTGRNKQKGQSKTQGKENVHAREHFRTFREDNLNKNCPAFESSPQFKCSADTAGLVQTQPLNMTHGLIAHVHGIPQNPGYISMRSVQDPASTTNSFSTLKNRPQVSHEAHISTGGVVSGFLTASRVSLDGVSSNSDIVSPIPGYPSFPSLLDSGAVNSNTVANQPFNHYQETAAPTIVNQQSDICTAGRFTLSGARSGRPLERISEDVDAEKEAERVENHEDGGASHHIHGQDQDQQRTLRHSKPLARGYDVDHTDYNEQEFGASSKRRKVGDDSLKDDDVQILPRPSSHRSISQHSHRREAGEEAPANSDCRPDFDTTTGADQSAVSLESLFCNLDQDLDLAAYEAACKRWSECTREEWIRGADEIKAEYARIIDFVLDHMTAKVTLYSGFYKFMDDRKDVLKERDTQIKGWKAMLTANPLTGGFKTRD